MMRATYILLASLLFACGSAPPVTPIVSAPEGSTSQLDGDPWTLRTTEPSLLLKSELNRFMRVVPVKSKAVPTGAYLVHHEGFTGELDGLVFVATKVGYPNPFSGDGVAYRVNVRGGPRNILLNRRNEGWLAWQYSWDSKMTEEATEVDGAAVLALRREQLRSGLLAKIAPTDRQGRIRWQNGGFKERVGAAEKACGIPAEIKWDTVRDEWFDSFAVGSACANRLRALEKFCVSYPHLQEELRQLGKMQCRFDGPPNETRYEIKKAPEGLVVVAGERHDYASLHIAVHFKLQALFGEDDQVLRAGEKLVVLKKKGDEVSVYSGTKENLLPQRFLDANDDYSRHHINLWAGGEVANLTRTDGQWSLQCGESVTKFETVFGRERENIIKDASFAAEPIWKREPYYLGRDTHGVYYFVDKMQDRFGGKHHRVFVGRRGQAQLTKLVGLVEDTQGMLFSTKKGNLRLIVGRKGSKDRATWIRGKQSAELTTVPLYANAKLIYQSLGPYFGQRLGDVCEE